MATTDGLTGILNRRAFLEGATKEVSRAQRYNNPLSFIMIDIDLFKNINDSYGHQIGDEAIISLIDTTKKILREQDLFGRVGGEEFAVVLPETTIGNAKKVGERLRKTVEETSIQTKTGTTSITISIGITSIDRLDRDDGIPHREQSVVDMLIAQADSALYQAKRDGRNRVAIYRKES